MRNKTPVPVIPAVIPVLNNVWKEYNKWKNEGNTGEFIYEINP